MSDVCKTTRILGCLLVFLCLCHFIVLSFDLLPSLPNLLLREDKRGFNSKERTIKCNAWPAFGIGSTQCWSNCIKLEKPISPGIPDSPFGPLGPRGPRGPLWPWAPLDPGLPGLPLLPFSPGIPASPAVPLSPSLPGGQYSLVAAQKSWMASSWKNK